jgi:hypothetical protein
MMLVDKFSRVAAICPTVELTREGKKKPLTPPGTRERAAAFAVFLWQKASLRMIAYSCPSKRYDFPLRHENKAPTVAVRLEEQNRIRG